MSVGGRISGVIRNSTGNGIKAIIAVLFDANGNMISIDSTDEDGNYSAGGIPTGSFKVTFINSSEAPYAGQWYNGKGEFASADNVTVTAPDNTLGINAVLGTGPDIFVFPVKKNFGDVVVSKSSSRNFSIFNDGSEALVLGTISLTGEHAAEFSIQQDQCSGRTLLPRQSCVFGMLFAPVSVGLKNADITIPSNDPDTAALNIHLSGTASSYEAVANWTNRDSGTTNALGRVTFGNGLFVTVGLEGTILTSPDGVAWTARNSGTTSQLFGVTYANGLFVATGNSGTILT